MEGTGARETAKAGTETIEDGLGAEMSDSNMSVTILPLLTVVFFFTLLAGGAGVIELTS